MKFAQKGEISVYFAIRGTMKSNEKDSLILIEYFLHDDITVLRSIFPSPVGARENMSNGRNVKLYYFSNHQWRNLYLYYHPIFYYFGVTFVLLSFQSVLLPCSTMWGRGIFCTFRCPYMVNDVIVNKMLRSIIVYTLNGKGVNLSFCQ